jgi:hypothetical protein
MVEKIADKVKPSEEKPPLSATQKKVIALAALCSVVAFSILAVGVIALIVPASIPFISFTAAALLSGAGVISFPLSLAVIYSQCQSKPQKQKTKPIQSAPTHRAKWIETANLKSYLEEKYGMTSEQVEAASAKFTLQVGNILDAAGVIQDPAGSAVGSSFLSGGGLSGAIYSTFNKLNTIPRIARGASWLNTGDPHILHTHSPHLAQVKDLDSAIHLISAAYLSAIEVFTNESQEDTLNLCAISAVIYAGSFQVAELGHLDPSITLTALCIALHQYILNNPDGLNKKNINLYYQQGNDQLIQRAIEVDSALRK